MKKCVAALLTVLGIVSSAEAKNPAKHLSSPGFTKNLVIHTVSAIPEFYFSPHAGAFRVVGAAETSGSAGLSGKSNQHAFFLESKLTLSGIFPVAPAIASASGTTPIHGDGEVEFSVEWNGIPGGAPLPDGHYRYDLEVTLFRAGPGSSGQVLDIDTTTGGEFIYDATPPVITLSPVAGSYVNQRRPTLAAQFTDALAGVDASTVRVILDGQDLTDAFTVTADGVVWNQANDLSEGEHFLEVIAADLAGNTASAVVHFIIDTTPPTLALEPADGAQVTTQRPALRATYGDALSGIDVSTASAAIDGADVTGDFTIEAGQAIWQSPADLSFGSHEFTFHIADRAGNVAAKRVRFEVAAPYRYFTHEGDEIRFGVVNEYFLVKLADGYAPVSILAALISAGASEIAAEADPFGLYEVGVPAGSSASGVAAVAKQILGVERVYPVVAWPDGRATGTAEGVYVKFNAGTNDADARALLAQAGAVELNADCCESFAYLAKGSQNDAADDFLLADTLRNLPGVEYAAPSLIIRYAESIGGVLPDSTTSTQSWLTQAGVQASWPTVYGGGNYFVSWTATPIGVLSTGVQSTHPALNGRVLPGYSAFGGSAEPNASGYLENSLGTAMAGILAANWESNGLHGITKDSPILPAKVREYSCGQISETCFWTTSDRAIKAGAKAALDAGARVLLFDSRYAEYLPQAITYLNQALETAADGRGALAVFPMGDEKHEIYTHRAPTPLRIGNSAFVTAVDESNRILERANVHATDSTRANFAAPGSPILTLDATGALGAGAGDTAVWYGTPMAAAIFAGSASMAYLIDRGLTVDELLSVAQSTGTMSEENIERSPLFKFLLWILSILHMQQEVEIDFCNSATGTPDFGVIHQAALGGQLAGAPLPVSVQLLQGQSSSRGIGFSVYKFTGGPLNAISEDLCARFDWSGNVNPLLIWPDKRVIRFANTTATEIRLRVDGSGGGLPLETEDMSALAVDAAMATNYRVLRGVHNHLTSLHEAKTYSVLGVSQPYSRTASLNMWTRAGEFLDSASSQIRACVQRCIFFLCSTVCSPAKSLLDTDDSVLNESLKRLKGAILANSSLAYEYRSLEADFDMNEAGFEDRILTAEAALRLEAFRQELSAAVGAELLLSAVGFFENPMDQIGRRYGDLIR